MTPEIQATVPEAFRGKFPRILYTANPIGPSVGFFRREFVKARAPFSIDLVHGFERQYIPSRAVDNKSVDLQAHIDRLAGLKDAALAKALDEGDWDAPVGDFFPEWDDQKHVISDFTPPKHWFRFRSFDWGTAEPFACYWFAVSDGESFTDHNHAIRWYPRGALIAYREWYGCDPNDPASGLRMRNEDIAFGILQRSPDDNERNLLTVTDSLPFQDRGGKKISDSFLECGVPLLLGDTSRIPGWSQMRSRLIGKKIDSNDTETTPMLFITSCCTYARDYIPALPRHANEEKKREDAAEHGEATHATDAIRLACMARARTQDGDPKPLDTANIRNDLSFNQVVARIAVLKKRMHGSSY